MLSGGPAPRPLTQKPGIAGLLLFPLSLFMPLCKGKAGNRLGLFPARGPGA